MNLTVHVYLHGDAEQQNRIERAIAVVLKRTQTMSQIVDDLVAEVANVKNAIDALEAKVTQILANSGMSQADKDAIAQAVADLKGAVADAGDGVDEAVVTP